jgi:hypothetical protein
LALVNQCSTIDWGLIIANWVFVHIMFLIKNSTYVEDLFHFCSRLLIALHGRTKFLSHLYTRNADHWNKWFGYSTKFLVQVAKMWTYKIYIYPTCTLHVRIHLWSSTMDYSIFKIDISLKTKLIWFSFELYVTKHKKYQD